MTAPTQNVDPVIIYLETTIGKVYTEQLRKQTAQVERFNIEALQKSLADCYQDLKTRRAACIDDLKEKTHSIQSHQSFSQDLTTISKDLDQAYDQSKKLASEASKLSVDFAQITDRLASATSIVTKAQNISTILKYIQLLDSSDNLDDIKRQLQNLGFPSDRLLLASEQIAKLLKIINISESKTAENTKRAKKNLMKMRNEYQVKAIDRMKDAFDKNQIMQMHDAYLASCCLLDSEGSIQTFISKLPYHNDDQNLVNDENAIRCMTDHQIQDHYDKLCNYLSQSCQSFWPKVDAVFERAQQAKLSILSDIFDHILPITVRTALEQKATDDHVNYCSMLEALYTRTVQFLDGIWELDHQQFSNSVVLEKMFQEDRKERYEQFEYQILEQSMDNMIKVPLEQLERVPTQNNLTNILKRNVEKIDPFDLYDPSIPSHILTLAASAWSRCAVVALPDKRMKLLSKIIKLTIFKALHNYLVKFVEISSGYLKSADDTNNIPRFMNLMKMINGAVMNLEEKYNSSLKTILLTNGKLQTRFINHKKDLMKNLEEKATQGLNNSVDIILVAISRILVKQKKTDFIGQSMNDQTPVSDELCTFLKNIINQIDNNFDDENKVQFYTYLGRQIFRNLKDHYKKFKFSQTGGICLMTDLKSYYEVLQSLHSPDLDQMMVNFVSITKLLHQPVNTLKEVWGMESYPPEITQLAKDLIERRVDSNEINMSEIFPANQT